MKRLILFLILILMSVSVLSQGNEDAGVAAEAKAEVDRADRGFLENLQNYCEEKEISGCEKDLKFYHVPYASLHYFFLS